MNQRAIASIIGLLSSAISVRYGIAGSKAVSNINKKEHVVFFTTNSWVDEATGTCHVPINGWVYQIDDRRIIRTLFAKMLERKYGLTSNADTDENFSYRTKLLAADEERGKRVVIKLFGQRYEIPKAEANGHFATTIAVPVSKVNESTIRYELVLRPSDRRSVTGESIVVQGQGVSIISDIDDTVKLSYVTDHKKLFESGFFHDFAPVEGMAELYQEWEKQGAKFHYVSSSPWQLYEPLDEFMREHGFPKATLSLKKVRFKDQTFFNLFKSATKTKPQAIKAILERYPERHFVLLGDSGEKDAQVYAQIAANYPQQIAKVYIRNVDGAADLEERYRDLFSGIERELWKVFDLPSEIELELPQTP